MYATCLFCNNPLGSNETFETFPVGRRLAFDANKGRLWVVCRHCERWNLSPLEEPVLSRGDDGSLALDLRFVYGSARFQGSEARRIAAIIVPKVNRFGGARRAVADAATAIDESGGSEGFLERLSWNNAEATRL